MRNLLTARVLGLNLIKHALWGVQVADNLPGAGKNTSAATKPVAFSPLGSGLQVDVGLENPFARGKAAVKSAVDRNTAGSSISPNNAADQVSESPQALL